jgi:hypothetical protein
MKIIGWAVALFVVWLAYDYYETQAAMTAAAGITVPTYSTLNNGPAVAVAPVAPLPATTVYPVAVRK